MKSLTIPQPMSGGQHLDKVTLGFFRSVEREFNKRGWTLGRKPHTVLKDDLHLQAWRNGANRFDVLVEFEPGIAPKELGRIATRYGHVVQQNGVQTLRANLTGRSLLRIAGNPVVHRIARDTAPDARLVA